MKEPERVGPREPLILMIIGFACCGSIAVAGFGVVLFKVIPNMLF